MSRSDEKEEKQKILIVDDEPRNQRIIAETLEDFYEFKTASSGEEAIKILTESFSADLVLLDIMMPGIDGITVCKQIRERPELKFTKIIFISGKAMLDERLKGYQSGADDYLTKPFMPEELFAKIKVFLQLTQTEKQLETLNQSLESQVKARTQELLNAEACLITSAKLAALGEMAGGIAHEINTPLSIIVLCAEQAQEIANGFLDGKGTHEDLADITKMNKKIFDTTMRISSIIQGLKSFSRNDDNNTFELSPLKQIIENTLVLCQEKIKHANIDFSIQPVADDLQINCNPVQISQILLNLISNSYDAIQHLPEKWIKIAVEKTANSIQLSVTDSGLGIPLEFREKIFQPFITTKEIGKGTGLGLSISKGLIESHQGSLRLDVHCKNTKFIIEFPKQPVNSEASKIN